LKYENLEKYVSPPRLDRYLIACRNQKLKSKKLYRANLRIAQAFYPVMNLFEIVLRNKIHEELSLYFSNPNWIIVEKNGFMNDSTLRPSRFFLKNQVIKAENKIIRRRLVVSVGKVIAEQNFGFWTTLFEPHHYRLIGGSIINCFPNKPANVNRSTISVKLQNIRDFRNRIYHNEPICFNGRNIDFSKAENIKDDLIELLSWIDDSVKVYVKKYDNIQNKIEIGKRI